jgi:deazaflavin-dependent oxidoreductase (nitroreductase family)
MQAPQWLARVNKYVTNPLQRLWAGWAPGMGILEHVGRRSGRAYRTPLIVFPTNGPDGPGIAVHLTYGRDRDWLKNVVAAGSATMRRHGRTITLTEPRIVSKEEAAQSVTGVLRPVFGRLPFDETALMRVATGQRE